MKILIILAFIAISYGCYDTQGKSNCEHWKKEFDFCKRRDAHYHCKLTCGICKKVSTAPHPTNNPNQRFQCGRSKIGQSRVVNGITPKPGSWPWIASLQRRGSHFCGGSLISPNWVLTAAHCVLNTWPKPEFSVNLGRHNLRNPEKDSAQSIGLKRVIINPDYNRNTLTADIALIELDRPAFINSRVGLACLPPRTNVYPKIGKVCYLAGWGLTNYPGRGSSVLQQTNLPVVDASKCHYQREVVCVGKGPGNGPDGKQHPLPCKGDSGGPLVCQQSNGRWQLEGVTSYAYKLCKEYAGYSPVNKYLPWIKKYVNDSVFVY